ncbi:sensor histidine kinase [Shewanella sp. GXUN23E]|uniref:sensor histidine kinase n=1 Tax=Shewanella sp. GXUN23E TaxID=3422498 RepID=UPI003D7DD376
MKRLGDSFNLPLCVSGVLGAMITFLLVDIGIALIWQGLLLAVFLAGFMWVNLSDWLKASPRSRLLAVLCQLGVYLTVILLSGNQMSSILLVIVAGQLPFIFSLPISLAILLIVNLLVWGLQLRIWPYAALELMAGNLLYLAFALFSLSVSRNVVQEKRARQALQLKNAELAATQALLEQSVRQSERRLLSRELHDICGHQLTALSLNLDYLAQQAPEPLKAGLLDTRQVARDLLEQIRKVVRDERSAAQLDLAAVLTQMVGRLKNSPVLLTHSFDGSAVPPKVAEAALRICQEGVTNAIKHGRGNVSLSVSTESGWLRIAIQNTCLRRNHLGSGMGLASMKERAHALGGNFAVQCEKGRWRLDAALPLEPKG